MSNCTRLYKFITTPRSLEFKSPMNTAAGKKLAKKFGCKYLKLRINESHYWIRIYVARTFSILHQFSVFKPEEFLNVIKLWIESMKQKIYADLLSYYEKKLKKQLFTTSTVDTHQRING